MSVIYLVLTHPDRSWVYDQEKVTHYRRRLELLLEEYPRYVCTLEHGEGANPHYNIIVWTATKQPSTTWTKKKITTGYYRNEVNVAKVTVKASMVDKLYDLMKYICKEEKMEVIGEKGDVFREVGKTPRELFEEYYKSSPARIESKRHRTYISKANMVEEVEKFLHAKDLEIRDYGDFIEVLVQMKRAGFVLLEVMNKPRHYYAMLNSDDADDKFREILVQNGQLM